MAVAMSAVATSAPPPRAEARQQIYGPAFRSSNRTWHLALACARSKRSSVVPPPRLSPRAAYSLPHMIHVQIQALCLPLSADG
jgi:hypothetical protein